MKKTDLYKDLYRAGRDFGKSELGKKIGGGLKGVGQKISDWTDNTAWGAKTKDSRKGVFSGIVEGIGKALNPFKQQKKEQQKDRQEAGMPGVEDK